LIIDADDAGAFRIAVKGNESATLRAHLVPFAATSSLQVRGGQRVTLRLVEGGSANGDVLDAKSSAPIADALVEVRDSEATLFTDVDPDFSVARARTDAKGRFTLRGLSGGPGQSVRVSARGYARVESPMASQSLRYRLVPGRSLSGRVVDGTGKPVSGARLSLRGLSLTQVPAIKGRSNRNGAFEIPGLENVPYHLVVQAEGFAPLVRDEVPLETSTLPLMMDRASIVKGRLVDEEGNGVKGRVRSRSHNDAVLPRELLDAEGIAEVGEDGRFTLSSLRFGTNVVTIAAAGYPTMDRTIEIPKAGEPVNLGDIVLSSGLAIRGRVVDSGGAPVASAQVDVFAFAGEASTRLFAQADGDGRFVARGLADRSYQVSIFAPGFANLTSTLTPSESEHSLVLKRNLKVTGRVVGPDGEPVPQGTLDFRRLADDFNLRMTRTETDGRFTAELSEGGVVAVSVTANGYMRLKTEVRIDQEGDIGEIRLSRGLLIRGSVVDARGGPIAGARVENQTRGQFSSVETDEHGGFELKLGNAGTVRLTASRTGYAPAEATVDVTEENSGREPVQIVLTRGARIEGTAKRRDGTPVPQAVVNLGGGSGFGARVSGGPVSTLTAADGSFAFEGVTPGPVTVSLMAGQSNRYTSVTSVDVRAAEGETANAILTLRTTIVHGTVRKGGTPTPRLRVSVNAPQTTMIGTGTVPSLVSDVPWHAAETKADGTFALAVSGPLSGSLSVLDLRSGNSLDSRPISIPDADDYTVDLDLAGIPVRGRVISDEGKPLLRARVMAYPSGDGSDPARIVRSSATDETGAFSFELDAGAYMLGVSSDGFVATTVPLTVSAPEASAGDIVLSPGGTLRGRAVLPSGRPAPMISVRTVSGPVFTVTLTDADGTFSLRGLAAGKVMILADGGDAVAIEQVEALSPTPVELRLAPAARIAVTVTGASTGRGTVGVTTFDGERLNFGIVSQIRDSQATLMVPAGAIGLRAAADSREGFAELLLQPSESASVTIDLVPKAAPKKD
jgi:protocatechuate 3,4-dioxygenase beta subunit